MNNTLFNNGTDRISYDSENCYLTLHQDYAVSVLIGPDGLIEAGLNLCEVPNLDADSHSYIYDHPDGVFSISAEPYDGPFLVTFFEGDHDLSLVLGGDVVALGLAFIRRGHEINKDNEKHRYGGRVTVTEVTA